jgi:hypothetical protein
LALALLAVGGAAWKGHLFGPHYAPTPYDDLLNQIVDRAPAARLGAIVAKQRPDLTAPALAKLLRQPGQTLAARAIRDAEQNRLMEADGWLVPQSVGLYAALAASQS